MAQQRIDAAMGTSSFRRFSRRIMAPTVPGVSALALLFLTAAYHYVDRSNGSAPQLSQAPLARGETLASAESVSGAFVADLRANARRDVALAETPAPLQTKSSIDATGAIAPPAPSSGPGPAPKTAARVEAAPPQQTAALDLVDAPQPPRRPATLKIAKAEVPPPPAPVAPPAQIAANPEAAPAPTTAPAPAPVLTRRQQRLAARAAQQNAAPQDNRNFIEKIFSFASTSDQAQPAQNQPGRAPKAALAYAAPEAGGLTSIARSIAPSAETAGPPPRADQFTAVYDINARTVYLPDGTRLEAHSGLGSRLDNPAFVHERMHGPTPPALYSLTPREALFHGVPALRLTPISGQVFGRAGLLAHTFMLGPNGDSNGCVSFRDYYAFLRAFQSGQVKRLMVVAHR
jgi:hypothetical protein